MGQCLSLLCGTKDTNNDGKIDAKDFIKQITDPLKTFVDGFKDLKDLNGDGIVDYRDAIVYINQNVNEWQKGGRDKTINFLSIMVAFGLPMDMALSVVKKQQQISAVIDKGQAYVKELDEKLEQIKKGASLKGLDAEKMADIRAKLEAAAPVAEEAAATPSVPVTRAVLHQYQPTKPINFVPPLGNFGDEEKKTPAKP